MVLKVFGLADSMIGESALPDRLSVPAFFSGGMGKSALDKLHGTLQSDFLGRRDQQMKMIWHENKGVHLVASLSPIAV